MREVPGDTEEKRNRRGVYYASIKRINANATFFERVWQLQPRCMALFGPKVEDTFLKLHRARRHIEVAAQMLSQRATEEYPVENEDTRKLYEQLRRDLWDHGEFEADKDRVGNLLKEFVAEVIAFAEPVIEQEYRIMNLHWWK